MSRRSRSQRPQKARPSDVPVREAPETPKVSEPVITRESSGVVVAVDELAALDAGWDELMSS
jgi:hypothetical protein